MEEEALEPVEPKRLFLHPQSSVGLRRQIFQRVPYVSLSQPLERPIA